jgi:hypothetical protein
MKVIDLKYPISVINEMFLEAGDEGTHVYPTDAAVAAAKAALMVIDTAECTADLEWHLPDVFDVRYGSSYVAAAWVGDRKVRFHTSDMGDFREGDDKM